jgi:hypothetical protein
VQYPSTVREDVEMSTTGPSKPDAPETVGTSGQDDPLAEIDRLMQKRSADEQRSTERSAQLSADRSEFSTAFVKLCEEVIRPAMEAILERLRRNGGGGVIQERPEESDRSSHRLILWMSLAGEIVGTPREDRHPYLRLDADVGKRSVTVSEGDMWQGRSGRSGRIGEWQLPEITPARVTGEVLDILRRSFG